MAIGHSRSRIELVDKVIHPKYCQHLKKLLSTANFQLLDRFDYNELKSHMICYNSMPLIGWNYSIQTGEQIL